MQGRPFALVGVNSDKKDRVKEAIQRERITWRSWWDGGSTGGPIASYYGVRGWPTIYVIDHQGVIRYKNVRGKPMDAAVERLLARAEVASEAEANEYAVGGDMVPKLRKWTDKSGSYTVMAAFLQFEDGEAHLQREDNKVIQVSMNVLCKEDQEFIRDKLRAEREKRKRRRR